MAEVISPSHNDSVTNPTGQAAAAPQASFFSEAYDTLTKPIQAGIKALEEHPYQSLALVTNMPLGPALAGERFYLDHKNDAITKAAEAIIDFDQKGLYPMDALPKAQSIPDVIRPTLDAGRADNQAATTRTMEEGYLNSLSQLKQLPTTYKVEAGDDLQSIAKKVVDARLAITGEHPSDALYGQENKRLHELNAGAQIKEGSEVKVYDQSDIKALAATTEYKYVPQLGQFLKNSGVTDTQINSALAEQKAEPSAAKKLLGQILVEQGAASKEQVDFAFANQSKLKAGLEKLRKEAGL